jgi:anaerobic ribonucleoside-triphosphate reductase activating protein
MNFVEIKPLDTANGPGIRVSLFVSGCTHHCKGCFNEKLWDFNYGKIFTKEDEAHILECMQPYYIKGFTLLGGEPLYVHNARVLTGLLYDIKHTYPNKDIWCYTGYTLETLLSRMSQDTQYAMNILTYIDVLVDGKFEEDKKDLSLPFRGSSNQRIIDVKKSLASNEIVLKEFT